MWILPLGLSFYVTTGELERLFSRFGLIEEGKNLIALCTEMISVWSTKLYLPCMLLLQ